MYTYNKQLNMLLFHSVDGAQVISFPKSNYDAELAANEHQARQKPKGVRSVEAANMALKK